MEFRTIHPERELVYHFVAFKIALMASCCLGTNSTVNEFAFSLIQVLHVSRPAALYGSTRYASEIVDRFFKKYTQTDVSHIEANNHKFCNLISESRLEIAFTGKPKRYKVPSYKVYQYEHSKGLAVRFEVEIRLIKRCYPSTL